MYICNTINNDILKLNLYYIFGFVIITCIVMGCSEYVDGAEYTLDQEEQLYIHSILTTDDNPMVIVKSAVPAYTDKEPQVFTDEDVEVSMVIDGDGKLFLDYDYELGGFTTNAINNIEGNKYSLNINTLEEGIKSSYSQTTVPYKDEFDELEVLEDYSFVLPGSSEGFQEFSYDVSFKLPYDLKGDYYMIQPVGRVIKQDLNVRTFTSDFDTYTINSVVNKPNHYSLTSSGKAILADFTNIDDGRFLEMNITLDANFQKSNRLQRHIYFYLYNITRDTYRYWLSGADSEYSETSFVEPIIEHTNIQNGLGIFGSAAISLDSVYIN